MKKEEPSSSLSSRFYLPSILKTAKVAATNHLLMYELKFLRGGSSIYHGKN